MKFLVFLGIECIVICWSVSLAAYMVENVPLQTKKLINKNNNIANNKNY